MRPDKIKISGHALIRMHQRDIAVEDIRRILEAGKVIESYEDDQPFPSYLIAGKIGARPLHVLAAWVKAANEAVIVTVYEPDENKWEDDFTRRRKKA